MIPYINCNFSSLVNQQRELRQSLFKMMRIDEREWGGGGYHSCSEKAGQSEASVGQQLAGKKKLWRWQVVPALMHCFPEKCQRWQGQYWFSPVQFLALAPFNSLMEGSWHQVTLSAMQSSEVQFCFVFFLPKTGRWESHASFWLLAVHL